MHLHKPIQKISELKDFFACDEKAARALDDFTPFLSNRYISRLLNETKQKGETAANLLCLLLLLPLLNLNNVRQLMNSRAAFLSSTGKDAYYRLKNNERMNWRKLLLQMAKSYKSILEQRSKWPGTFRGSLIIDDTIISKRGSSIEGVSRTHDHARQCYILGFQMLVIGYWDGHCFIPLDFTLHRSRGSNKKKPYGLSKAQKKRQYQKQRNPGSPGARRKKELDTSKTVQALKLIKRAVKHGFIGGYVLFDSWYFSEKLLRGIKALKNGAIEVIAMAKWNVGKYRYNGEEYKCGQLKQKLKGQKKRCRKLKATYIECQATYKGIPVQLFMVRYHRKSKWRVMVTTDLQLSFIAMMQQYSHRWCIEVFFKEAKQYLHLGKSQSRDFDAQVGEATIAMMRYIVLTFHKRFNQYESIGALFHQSREAAYIITLADRIWALILEVVSQLCQLLEVDPDDVAEKLMAEPVNEKDRQQLLHIIATLQQTEIPPKKAA